MLIITTALALTAGAQAAPTTQVPAADPVGHAQHQQMAKDHDAKGCACCQHMAAGEKMACCEEHEKAQSGEHADNSGM